MKSIFFLQKPLLSILVLIGINNSTFAGEWIDLFRWQDDQRMDAAHGSHHL